MVVATLWVTVIVIPAPGTFPLVAYVAPNPKPTASPRRRITLSRVLPEAFEEVKEDTGMSYQFDSYALHRWPNVSLGPF